MRARVGSIFAGGLLAALIAAPAAVANGAPQFGAPVRLEAKAPVGTLLGNGQRQPSGEPSIKVDSAGRIYVAGVTSVGQASPVWVSLDGGKTFESVPSPGGLREKGPLGAEGDLAIDRADRVYFVDTAVPNLVFSRWSPSPSGPSWDFTRPHTLGVLPGVDDRPWLAYGGDGQGESLWLYVNHVSHIAVYRSTDEGLTWHESTSTLPEQRFFTGMVAAPRDDSQTAYLFGNCGDDDSLCVRYTHDGGGVWTEKTVAEVDSGREIGPIMVANAVDAAGITYGTWSEADGDDGAAGDTNADDGCDVFYAASTDGGENWGPKVRVNDGSGCAAFPWIAAGSRGRIALAWYETPQGGPHPDEVAKDAKWFLHAAVVHPADRQPAISSARAVADPVHVGPLARDLWDYLQVAGGPDGLVHIAYSQDTDAGPDGPLGSGLRPSNGTNSKDTMYVRQRSGPRLSVPAGRPAVAASRRPRVP